MSNKGIKLTRKEKVMYLEMIFFYRKHPCLAARDLLGVRLSAHQRMVVKAIWKNPNIALVMSRGMSKTFTLAVIALLHAILYSGMKVLVASGQTFRQGQMVLEEAESILLASNKHIIPTPFAKVAFGDFIGGRWKVLNRGQDSWSLQVGKDGSTIKTFPMGNPQKIRGYRAHLILLDERNAVPDEIVQKVIAPFANVKRDVIQAGSVSSEGFENTFVHAGTIEYTWQGFARLIRSFLKVQDGNTVVEFNYEDAYKYGINVERIEKERDSEEGDIRSWSAENKNQLLEDSDTYYGGKLILQQAVFDKIQTKISNGIPIYESFMPYKKSEKKLLCFMGIDPARQTDEFAITVLAWDRDANLVYPIFQQAWKKTLFQDVVDFIFKLICDRYNVKRVGLDQGGGGTQVRDLLLSPKNLAYPGIYDPSDEDSLKLLQGKRGRAILRMLKPNAERNTIWNANMKQYLQSGKFKFVDFMFVPKMQDKEEEKVYRSMVDCKRQFVMVKTKASSVHTNLTFYAESGKKDLYSSTLYALSVLKDYEEETIKRANSNEELPIGAWI